MAKPFIPYITKPKLRKKNYKIKSPFRALNLGLDVC